MSQEQCVDCGPSSAGTSSSTAQTAPQSSGSASAVGSSTQIDQRSFAPPSLESLTPRIIIEFCDRCRWAPRATWIQTELFLTFPTPIIRSITLQPLTSPETGGRFRVWVYHGEEVDMVWDRKTEGGFPELKVLKQRIRNILQPDLNLGHSDKPSTAAHASTSGGAEKPVALATPVSSTTTQAAESSPTTGSGTPNDPRTYCDFRNLVKKVQFDGQASEEEQFRLWSLRL